MPAPEAAVLDHARRAYLGEIADGWPGRQAAARRAAAYLTGRLGALG